MSRVTPGDPFAIRARDWNETRDAARALARTPVALRGGGARTVDPTAVIVVARNASEAHIPLMGTAYIKGPTIIPTEGIGLDTSPWWRQMMLDVEATEQPELDPEAYPDDAPFGIAVTPIPPGKFGRLCIAGCCQTRVNVLWESGPYYAESKFCRLLRGSPWLNAHSFGGTRIIWIDEHTEEPVRRAIVEIGRNPPESLSGEVTDSEAIEGGGADAYRYTVQRHGTAGDVLTDPTGDEVPVVNFFEFNASLRTQVRAELLATVATGGSVSTTVLPIPNGTLVMLQRIMPFFAATSWISGSGTKKVQYAFNMRNAFTVTPP